MGAMQTRHERAVGTDLAVDNCLSEYTHPALAAETEAEERAVTCGSKL